MCVVKIEIRIEHIICLTSATDFFFTLKLKKNCKCLFLSLIINYFLFCQLLISLVFFSYYFSLLLFLSLSSPTLNIPVQQAFVFKTWEVSEKCSLLKQHVLYRCIDNYNKYKDSFEIVPLKIRLDVG